MDKAGMEPTPEGRTGDAIRGAAEGAKEEFARLGEEVKEKSASILHNQREAASQQIHSLAHALEAGADTLDDDGQPRMAEYARGAAERVHHMGDDFLERDLGRAIDNVSRYAKDNPALIIGSAAAFGFLLTRFLKSSGARSSGSELEARETSTTDTRDSRAATDIGYAADEQERGDMTSEGMAPGISPLGESTRAEDTGRRFGDGTES